MPQRMGPDRRKPGYRRRSGCPLSRALAPAKARQRIAALRLPACDEVEAFVELREQARDLAGVVLEIAVDRHDSVARGLVEGQQGTLTYENREFVIRVPLPDQA